MLNFNEKDKKRAYNHGEYCLSWVPFGSQLVILVDILNNWRKQKNTADIDSAVFCAMVRVLVKDYKVRMHTEDLCAA